MTTPAGEPPVDLLACRTGRVVFDRCTGRHNPPFFVAVPLMQPFRCTPIAGVICSQISTRRRRRTSHKAHQSLPDAAFAADGETLPSTLHTPPPGRRHRTRNLNCRRDAISACCNTDDLRRWPTIFQCNTTSGEGHFIETRTHRYLLMTQGGTRETYFEVHLPP